MTVTAPPTPTDRRDAYPFAVGTSRCLAISDGIVPSSAGLFFPGAPADRLTADLGRHALRADPIPSPWTCLLVDTGRQRVLLDAGGGPAVASIVPGTGTLRRTLEHAGVRPETVDVVVATHGHPDHIGGLVDESGEPAFPNARVVMGAEEWAFWTDEAVLSRLESSGDHIQELLAAVARRSLPPLRDRLDLLDGESAVASGVVAVPAPGHTPGHLAVALESAGEHLLFLADAALHPIHLEEPEWHPVFDLLPEDAAATKRRLLDRAAADHALVHAFHFPFPGLGHVRRRGGGWVWEPAEQTA
jgi:glyoxylase-like metal-dependent hydrolase (beta-lactamase superfamily II)